MKKIRLEYYFVVVLLLLFIVLTILVNNGNMDAFDEKVYNALILLKGGFITRFLYVITQLASTVSIISLTAVSIIIFLIIKKRTYLKYLIIDVASAALSMKIIKEIVQRPRPEWKWIVQDGFSYPSGHTISAYALYGTLMLLVYKKMNNKFKVPLMILFGLMIILTGISRIFFGVHYFSDVLGSLILGTVIMLIVNIFMNKEFENDKNKVKKTI